jgi:anti-sigma regulatory factor (Ser/Thr protein kinase)
MEAVGQAGKRVTARLTPLRSAPALARASLAPLRSTLSSRTYQDVALAVSELVSDRVEHAGLRSWQEIVLEVEVGDSAVHGIVRDAGQGPGANSRPHGPYRIDSLNSAAKTWGARRAFGATRVWFDVARVAAEAAGSKTVRPSDLSGWIGTQVRRLRRR